MRGRLPALRAEELARALEGAGFQRSRMRGSHARYAHPDGRRVTVPMHRGTTIGRGLLRKILRDAGMTADDLAALL